MLHLICFRTSNGRGRTPPQNHSWAHEKDVSGDEIMIPYQSPSTYRSSTQPNRVSQNQSTHAHSQRQNQSTRPSSVDTRSNPQRVATSEAQQQYLSYQGDLQGMGAWTSSFVDPTSEVTEIVLCQYHLNLAETVIENSQTNPRATPLQRLLIDDLIDMFGHFDTQVLSTFLECRYCHGISEHFRIEW